MDDLVPIGRFSRMTRLSIKALRHYDELGLLDPARVDPSSGYRYYRPRQANRAEAIRILRSVDMPLDEIRVLLSLDDPEVIGKRLRIHRDELAARLAEHERMLRFLEHLIEREGQLMPYEIEIKAVSPQPVAAYRTHTDLSRIGDDIGAGFQALVHATGAASTPIVGAPLVVYHDVIDEETAGDVEVCVPVPSVVDRDADDDADGDSGPTVAWRELEGGPVATTVHHGPYQEIAPAYHTLMGWIQEHGHEVTGPPREIYLNDPQEVAPEELLTEVQFPIDADA